MTQIDTQRLTKILGRHSRLPIRFSFQVAGTTVNLQSEGYQAWAWVQAPSGEMTTEGVPMTVSGQVATYQLSDDDLAAASTSDATAAVIHCVADNGVSRLVSDKRAIRVGDWPGADGYEPGAS